MTKRKNRNVQDGKLISTSASRIKDYRECPRKWYYDQVVGIPRVQSKAQADGESYHLQVEKYLLEGKPPDFESIRHAIQLGMVPRYDPNAGYLIEEPRNFNMGLSISGVGVKGKIDYQAPFEATRDQFFKILDWKFVSSFRYVPTEDELARDVQCLLYLKYGFEQHKDAEQGVFGHVYMTKGKTGARDIYTEPLTREYVDSTIQDVIEPVVEKMKLTVLAPSPEDVEPNKAACYKYGGCPHKESGLCSAPKSKPTTSDLWASAFEAAMGEEDMSGIDLMAKIRARREKLAKTKTEEKVTTPEPVLAKGVNPPDAPPPKELEEKVNAPEPTPEPEPVKEPEPKTEEKPKRRRTAAKKKAETPKEVDPEPTPITTIPTGLRLFIGCEPTKIEGEIVRLEDIIEERQAACIEAVRKIEPSTVPEDCKDVRQIAFGRGASAMVLTFKNVPPTGNVVAQNVGLSAQVVEVLTTKADLVVWGRA